MNLCENLQRLRRQAGLSQEALAEKLGVSRQAVSKWESGAAVPELEKLAELARIFQVRLDQLLGLPEPEGGPPPGSAGPSGAAGGGENPDKRLRDLLAASRAQTASHYKKLLAAAGTTMAAMLLGITLLFAACMNRWEDRFQNELSRLQGSVSSLQGQIGALNAAAEESEDFFLSSGIRVTQLDPAGETAVLHLTATPRAFSAEGGAPPDFVLSGESWSQSAEAVRGAGNDFSADIEVPLLEKIEISFAFTASDGTERVEPVDTLYNLDSVTQLVVWPDFDGSYTRFNLERRFHFRVTPRAALSVRGEEFFLSPEIWAPDIRPPEPVSGHADLTHNGEVLARSELTFSAGQPDGAGTADEQAAAVASGDILQYAAEGEPIDCECPYSPGDRIALTLYITDSYGQEYEAALIDLLIGEDGEPIEHARPERVPPKE